MLILTIISYLVFLNGVFCEKVLIIGAGASGIAAASKLLDNNFTNFRILESEDRLGGRINSISIGDKSVDLGAQYVHGGQGNIVFDLCKKMLEIDTTNETWFYYMGKQRSENEDLSEILNDLETEVWEKGSLNISLGDIILRRYNVSVLEKYKDDPNMFNYGQDFIRTCENSVIIGDAAPSWFDMSSFDDFNDLSGTYTWKTHNYQKIFEVLLENHTSLNDFISKKVTLGKTVSKITLDNQTVIVKTEDNSIYTSDFVIFTPSLGVLKHDHRNMFQPELDKEKMEMIDNIGFGGVVKIILQFSEVWWDDKIYYEFVWSKKDVQDARKEITFGPLSEGKDHWLTWFTQIGADAGISNVLVGWISGPSVSKIEQLSEKEMETGVMYTLRKFLGQEYNVTDPIRTIHSKWCTNPNFRGTYSFNSVHMDKYYDKSPRMVLSEAIKSKDDGVSRIYFAGEATHPTRYGTVDGAIETGYREAENLLKYL